MARSEGELETLFPFPGKSISLFIPLFLFFQSEDVCGVPEGCAGYSPCSACLPRVA